MKQPPDENVLKQLIRGELSREDRIAVDTWLCRNLDISIPHRLLDLSAEIQDEKADADLKGYASDIGELFRRLVRGGYAFLDALQPQIIPSIAMLSVPYETTGQIGLTLRQSDDCIVVPIVHHPTGYERAVVIASSDDKSSNVHILIDHCFEQSDFGQLKQKKADRHYKLEQSDCRVTFWLALFEKKSDADPIPGDQAELIAWLERCQQSNARLFAQRLGLRTFEHIFPQL